MTKKLSVIVDYRILAVSLVMATEQLEKVTNLPKPTWVDYIAHAAKRLVLNSEEATQEAIKFLAIADIGEADFMNALFFYS